MPVGPGTELDRGKIQNQPALNEGRWRTVSPWICMGHSQPWRVGGWEPPGPIGASGAPAQPLELSLTSPTPTVQPPLHTAPGLCVEGWGTFPVRLSLWIC